MTVENQRDIDGILKIGRLVALVRDAMLDAIEPGITTAALDRLASGLLEQHGAKSAPRLMYNFPVQLASASIMKRSWHPWAKSDRSR